MNADDADFLLGRGHRCFGCTQHKLTQMEQMLRLGSAQVVRRC